MADIEITGLDALYAALDRMVVDLDAATERAARKAGAEMVSVARRNAPVGRSTPGWAPKKGQNGKPIPAHTGGTLRRSIAATPPERISPGRYQIKVGPTVIYGRFRDQGGTITPKHGAFLRFMAINSFNVGKGGKYSYAPAFARSVTQKGSFFMERSVEQAKPRIDEIVRSELAGAIPHQR